MELKRDFIKKKKLDFLTINEFIDKYHIGVSTEAVGYAIKQGYLDFFQPARDRFVVLTLKTLTWAPREDKRR